MSLFLEAEKKWITFLDSKIRDYSTFRNYDYGPNSESSVSQISPYVSHRVLLEYQLIQDINLKYNANTVNKFIEEVYWRIYWKGWLENRPSVWERFIKTKNENYDFELYEKALKAQTNLPFFNAWIDELKNFNYLHNHTRMWFASTWIFNLGLPWELGAKLFFEHLYDGDAASNLLSWRWVAGLQTKGKKYLFTPKNLKKFSNNRFIVNQINNQEINISDEFDDFISEDIYKSDMKKNSEFLILFENDLNFETLKSLIKNYKKVFLIVLENDDRVIKISKSVYSFKKRLICEFKEKFTNVEIISSASILSEFNNISKIDVIYPSVGENKDFVNRFIANYKKEIKFLVREEDLYSWQFAKKGYFNFKKNIPMINKFLERPKIIWR